MPVEPPKEFSPLMDSIEKVLNAIDSSADQQTLLGNMQELRDKFNEYKGCCCRKAHVIPYDEQA
jgi:hypothetical protein